MKDRAALIRRLGPYWKIEAGNAVLLPATMLYLSGGEIGWISAIALVPMIGMLVVGAAYWRAKTKRLIRVDYDIRPTLRTISIAQKPLLVLTIIGTLSALIGWLFVEISVSAADRICATVAASLALLEYVNYYYRQLQHFDNIPDFKRLLSGNGFRPSQMAKDLKTYRFR